MTTIAIAAGGSAAGADWSETLDANAYLAYDSNPRLLPGSSIADRSAQLIVDGNTTMQTEVGQLVVTPRFSSTRYQQDTNLDVDTGSISLSYAQNLERGQWTANAEALTDSTLTSELGTTGITDVNFRHYADSASLGYTDLLSERLSWQLQGSWQGTRYNGAAQHVGLSDYDYGAVQSGLLWNLTPLLLGSVTLETDRINPQGRSAEKDYSAILELKHSLSERYAWRISAGDSRVDAGAAGSGSSSVFELGASRQGERVQWDLSVRRSVLPIGLGLLAREDVAALSVSAATSERSTLNLSVNAIRSDPVTNYFYLNPEISIGFLVYSGATWGQASAEWLYHLTPCWIFSAAYVQNRARNNEVPQWANGNQARLGIVWQSGRL